MPDEYPHIEEIENAVNDAINWMRRAVDHVAADDTLRDENNATRRKYMELAQRMTVATRHFHAAMTSDERPERASTSREQAPADDDLAPPEHIRTHSMSTTQGQVETRAAPQPQSADKPKR